MNARYTIVIVGWVLCVPKFASSHGDVCGKKAFFFLGILFRLGFEDGIKCLKPWQESAKLGTGQERGRGRGRSGTQTNPGLGLVCNPDTGVKQC